MKNNVFLRAIPMAGVLLVISAILALNIDTKIKKADPLDISSIEAVISDQKQLDEAVAGLNELYHCCAFSYAKVDSIVGSLMENEEITAFDVTKTLIKHLENSSLKNATDLQVELLYWLSRSGRSYDYWRSRLSREELTELGRARRTAPFHYTDKMVKAGRFYDLADIGEFGKLAMNWIHHEDPFVRGLAEWAIANRIDLRNNEPLKIWPEDEKKAPNWYHVWKGMLETEFVLEADYVRQGVRLDIHRSPDDILDNAGKIVERSRNILDRINADGTKEAVPEAGKWMNKLLEQHKKLESAVKESPGDLTAQRKIWLDMRKLARKVILNNPDIKHRQTLLALRHAYHCGGNITNGGKSYNHKPGGDIFIKDGLEPGAGMRPLIGDKLPPGHMEGMELWYDADRIVFSYAKQPDYFNEIMWDPDQSFNDFPPVGLTGPALLYEMNLRNNSVRQLTAHPYNHDIEPAYLPNGDIVFASTRSDFGSQCSGSFLQNKKIANMFICGPDGQNVRSLSNNKDFDRYPHIMNNGKIVYTRWEYQERHLWQVHNLWACRPDGSYREPLFKQHNHEGNFGDGPMSLRDARAIPNSDKLVAVGTGHHEWAEGGLYLIDYQEGINEPDGFRIITPEIADVEGGLGDKKIVEEGGVIDYGGLYRQPYPLSEESFLTCYSYFANPRTEAANWSLYYIDVWGNKELIHRDPVLSVAYPIVFSRQEKPTELSGTGENPAPYATVYMVDIYQGVPEVQPGDIKYIRIGNHTEWPAHERTGDKVVDFNHYHYTPSGSWSSTVGLWTWCPARVIGTVPVEEDGSAHFKVPADIPVYFQALDENYREIRRMRSFVTLRPGEIRGCTGCHESRDETPFTQTYEAHNVPSAVQREPSKPDPPAWGDRELPDFERDIQPIFSRHCASCHGAETPGGGLDFTDRKIDGINQAYRTLFGLRPDEPTPNWDPDIYQELYPEYDYEYRNNMWDRQKLEQMGTNRYPGQLVSISNRFSDNAVTRVKEFGSTQSMLLRIITNRRHRERVDMSPEEWVSLVTWIDLNVPYWGSFVDKEPLKVGKKPKRVFVKMRPPFESPDYQGMEVVRKTDDY